MLTMTDLDIQFSLIEFSELLEYACVLAATSDGALNKVEYDATFAKVAAALDSGGAALVLQLAQHFSQAEEADAHSDTVLQQLLSLCAA